MEVDSTSAQSKPVALPGNLVVDEIAGLKVLLCNALQTADNVNIDPTAVKTADTASLQLLAAFVNRANAIEKTVIWSGFSAALTTAANLLGLQRHLGLKAGEERH